jgi:parallel beta-helix repeat protein
MRGTVIRYNYIHDLTKRSSGEGFNEVMGVYLDDTACGTTVYGNIFNRISEAILVGGGRDNIIENNIFVNSGDQSIVVDARGLGWAKASCAPGGDWHMYSKLKEIHFDQPPYSTHYPALATILKGNPAAPAGDEILRNICVGAKWLYLQDGLTDKTIEVKNNFVGADPGFVNAARDDYRLKKSSPVWALGFKPIPVQKIGIEK